MFMPQLALRLIFVIWTLFLADLKTRHDNTNFVRSCMLSLSSSVCCQNHLWAELSTPVFFCCGKTIFSIDAH